MKKKESTSDIVKDFIFNQLESKQLTVCNRLPTEAQLASTLNISRTSVREALQALKSIGLIESSQGSGYTVVCNTEKSFSDSLRAMMAVKETKLTDISEIREALEIKASELAITRGISDKDISYLSTCIENMETTAKTSSTQTTEYDINFHRKIAEMSGNSFLTSFIFALSSFSSRYILISWDKVDSDEIQELLTSHRNIVHYLKKKNIDLARTEIINHYQIADKIINHHVSNEEINKDPFEPLLQKFYAKGYTTAEIYARIENILPDDN